jgi:hypothetical protein
MKGFEDLILTPPFFSRVWVLASPLLLVPFTVKPAAWSIRL